MITEEEQTQLTNEIKIEERQEFLQEQREEVFNVWFDINKESILTEFAEMYADELTSFAKDCYRRETE